MSGRQLAVYSRGTLQRKLYKANPQRTVSGGQLAVYSRRGFAEEGRQRRRMRGGKEKRKGEDRRILRNLINPHRVVRNSASRNRNYLFDNLNQTIVALIRFAFLFWYSTLYFLYLAKIYLAAATAWNAPPAKFWISKLYIWRRHRLKIPRARNDGFTKEVCLWLYMGVVSFLLCG